MKYKAKLFGIYLPIYLLALIAAVTLRTVALFLDYSEATGYFDGKTIISVADYTVISVSLFLFTYAFTARKDIKLVPNFTSSATYIPTAAVFIALIFMLKFISDECARTKSLIKYLQMLGNQSAVEQIPTQNILLVLLYIAFIFVILSAVHFVLTALIESHSSTKRAYFGLGTTVFFSVYAAYIYFNTELPINAPNKVLDQIAFLFFAAFFLFEARLSIGREKWRGYIAFGFIASLLAAYTSVPSTVYYFVSGKEAANSIYETALCFTLFIFITARVLLTGELIEDKPSATVDMLREFSDRRTAEIAPIPALCDITEITGETLLPDETEARDANQLTIDDMGIIPLVPPEEQAEDEPPKDGETEE